MRSRWIRNTDRAPRPGRSGRQPCWVTRGRAVRRCRDAECDADAQHEADQTENRKETTTVPLTTIASGWAAGHRPLADASRFSRTSVAHHPDTSGLVRVGIRVASFARRHAAGLAALARLISPSGSSVCALKPAAVFNQGAEARLGERMASLLGVPVGSLRTSKIAPIFEQAAEPERALSIASLVGPPERGQRAAEVSLVLQQDPQIDRTSRLPAFLCAAEGSHRGDQLTLLGEQSAEVQRPARVASLVRPRVGGPRTREVSLLL